MSAYSYKEFVTCEIFRPATQLACMQHIYVHISRILCQHTTQLCLLAPQISCMLSCSRFLSFIKGNVEKCHHEKQIFIFILDPLCMLCSLSKRFISVFIQLLFLFCIKIIQTGKIHSKIYKLSKGRISTINIFLYLLLFIKAQHTMFNCLLLIKEY